MHTGSAHTLKDQTEKGGQLIILLGSSVTLRKWEILYSDATFVKVCPSHSAIHSELGKVCKAHKEYSDTIGSIPGRNGKKRINQKPLLLLFVLLLF